MKNLLYFFINLFLFIAVDTLNEHSIEWELNLLLSLIGTLIYSKLSRR